MGCASSFPRLTIDDSRRKKLLYVRLFFLLARVKFNKYGLILEKKTNEQSKRLKSLAWISPRAREPFKTEEIRECDAQIGLFECTFFSC